MPTKEAAGGVVSTDKTATQNTDNLARKRSRILESSLTTDKAVAIGETAVAVETAVVTVDPRSRVPPPPSVFMHPPRSRLQERVQDFTAR